MSFVWLHEMLVKAFSEHSSSVALRILIDLYGSPCIFSLGWGDNQLIPITRSGVAAGQ